MSEGNFSAGKNNFRYFVGHQNELSQSTLDFFPEPKGHFRIFFRENFLSTIMSGQFLVDPENLSP